MNTRTLRFGLRILSLILTILAVLLLPDNGRGQGKPPVSGTPNQTADAFPAAKKTASANSAQDADVDASQSSPRETEKDSPDAIRKRDEWFYKQRASVNGRIPAGARLKALQHMQQMMVREGKLVQRADGTFAEATSPTGTPSTPVWNSIGPTPTTGGTFSPVTGRITTIAVDPSDATGNTVLIGGAQGGIWRSTNAGLTWSAQGDQNASLAMGSIAFAPSSAKTVYAGTGEQASIGFDIYYGAGVLKSTDGGLTWAQTCTVAGPSCPFIGPYLNSLDPGFGFFNFGGAHISYVAVNPSNPQMILAATQFVLEGPQEGVYCSSNGGQTWTNILPDEMATFVGFASSSVAFAALGNPFGSSAGAPNGNGIYKSTNASSCSATFTPLAGGLPAQTSMGRMDLGISPNYSSDSTVYASIADATTGSSQNLGVWVTNNGGTTWTATAAPDICQEQCWYDNVIKVDPNNKSIAFFGGAAVSDSSGNPIWVERTTTSGTSWSTVIPNQLGTALPHVDTHALAFVKLPGGKVRLYLGNDGGIWRTDDAEAATITWTNLNDSTLTLTQFYPSISINTSSPSIAFAGTQDNGSQNYQGASAWVDNNQCGDGGSSAVDAVIPSTVYIGCATGFPVNASYQNGALGTFSSAVNGINSTDAANFIPPLATDPNTANVLYFGTTKVYQSIDAGNTWNSMGQLVSAGGDVLTALAIEPGNPKVVYAGSTGGEVFATQTSTTDGSPSSGFFNVGEFPIAPRAVTGIAVDPTDASGNTAYVALSGFAFNGTDPLNGSTITDLKGHLFKTTNANSAVSATFVDVSCSTSDCSKPAATDLPNLPVNDVVLDPDAPGTIYAATDLGVYVGNCTVTPCAWSTLGTGLPRVAVLSLRLHEASRTLFAATHGRGIWTAVLGNISFTGPRIASLTPQSTNAGGTSTVTLTVNGSGLTGGTANLGATALSTTVVSDSQLTATIPTNLLTAGSQNVTVTIGAPPTTTTSNALPFEVLALTPTLTSCISSIPASSSASCGTPMQTTPTASVQLTLTGTNLANNEKTLFDGASTGITSHTTSATTVTATLPSSLLGPFGSTNDVAALNTPPGGGKSQPITFKVVAPPPPDDNFANAITVTSVMYTDIEDASNASTESTDPTPPSTCVQQISAAQGNTGGHLNGVYNTLWYKFTPIFSANVEVDTIGSSYDTVLSIWTGSAGALTPIACNDDINPGTNVQSQISNVPLTANTTYYIMVSSFGPPDPNPIALGGKSVLNLVYNNGASPVPTVTSISPTSAASGSSNVTLNITGSLFVNNPEIVFACNTETLQNNLVPTYISSTQLSVVIPASALVLPGSCSVIVFNPGTSSGGSTPVPFTVTVGTYPVPTVTSIFPTTAVAGSLPFQFLVQGSNFASTAVLSFNGVPIPTTAASTTSLTATIPTNAIATAGTVPVTVSNPSPGGGPSAPQSFAITQPSVVPSITAVSPSTVTAGFPVSLTITGTGFAQGAFLNIGGNLSNSFPTNFISSTQVSVQLSFVTVGTIPVYIVDQAPGGTSAPFNLTVTQPPAPAISSISPTSAQTGTGVTLTINGSNFEPDASVLFNNSNSVVYYTSVVNTNQITTTLALGGVAAGTYAITVANPIPTPTASNAVNFTVIGPPDFSFTVGNGLGSQTVTAGQTATFMNAITVNAVNGFTGQVAVSCTSPAQATSCSVSPTTLTAGQSASIMVTTTARSATVPLSLRNRPLLPWLRVWPTLLLTMLLCVLLLRWARTRRQRVAAAIPLAGLLLFLLLQASGCGGGGGTIIQPPPPTGTPAGTYTITVTGTSANTQHTATVQLVVN